MTIRATRMNRVLGSKPRQSAWHAFEHYTAMETVQRDPRPARAIMGYVMTAIALVAVITIGSQVALTILEVFAHVSRTIASI